VTCIATEASVAEASSTRAEIRVETISSYQEFLNLEPVWNEVAEAAGLDHPFLEHAWIRTWWECFGAGSTLQILVLKAGEQPIAIAPLILTPIRMWGIKLRRLGFFYNAHVPRADFIIAHWPEEAYRAIWSHLFHKCSWDLLQLCQLPSGSETLDAIPRLAAADDSPTGAWPSGASPYLPLLTSWGQYFEGLPAKHRGNLRNRFKRLKGIGSLETEVITSEEKLADALEAGLRLEAAGWKGKSRTAISCYPDTTRFYSMLARRAAESGWLLLNVLRAGSKRIAFDYCLSYKNRMYRLKSGYDPAYARYSPSGLLFCSSLRNAFEQNITEYDFLGGTEDWKQKWTKCARQHYWLFVFSHTFKGRLLHLIKFQLVPLFKRAGLDRVRNLFRYTTTSPSWGTVVSKNQRSQ
ncbi:MAG TPA: GNAT family N-acetyltransferase, partial [Bryobacteraceae bacterium]|nr:GNAT family N-acetyltransferase [Bryobacteraceae bacterium]